MIRESITDIISHGGKVTFPYADEGDEISPAQIEAVVGLAGGYPVATSRFHEEPAKIDEMVDLYCSKVFNRKNRGLVEWGLNIRGYDLDTMSEGRYNTLTRVYENHFFDGDFPELR